MPELFLWSPLLCALDTVVLARLQFAIAACFHIIFPSVTIGLSWFLLIFFARSMRARRRGDTVAADHWGGLYDFWLKVFALTFGIGVVSGIVMSFQFGLNWAGWSTSVGPVLGPLIGMEVATAFFLEAGFFGIMVFGRHRVRPGVYLFSIAMVAIGTLLSATWIMSANSWLHTPRGFGITQEPEVSSLITRSGEGTLPVFHVQDWWAVLWNPSFVYRMPHMVLASFVTASFFCAGIHAWQILRRPGWALPRRGFGFAMGAAAVFIPLQIWMGDQTAAMVGDHMPTKTAAIEGYWDTTRQASWKIAVIPDPVNQRNTWELGIPYLGSLLAGHELNAAIPGLKEVPASDRPNVWLTFYSFRVMFFLGILMFAAAFVGVVLRARGRLTDSRWFLRVCVGLIPAGTVATICGWIASECGRQPWVVWQQVRTADMASDVGGSTVLAGVLAFSGLYLFLLVSYSIFAARIVRGMPPTEVA